jgi:hypothetical protein
MCLSVSLFTSWLSTGLPAAASPYASVTDHPRMRVPRRTPTVLARHTVPKTPHYALQSAYSTAYCSARPILACMHACMHFLGEIESCVELVTRAVIMGKENVSRVAWCENARSNWTPLNSARHVGRCLDLVFTL